MRTADGWIMENLSANGTAVNGRRYKADKQILLATGDVIGVGMETEILFVAGGDDPAEAIARYRQSQQSPNLSRRPNPPPRRRPPCPPPRPASIFNNDWRPPASSRRPCRMNPPRNPSRPSPTSRSRPSSRR